MPENWKIYKLGDVITIRGGFSYKGKYIGSGDSLLLGMGCVSNSKKFLKSGARPYSGDCRSVFLLNPGDMVLATRQQSDNLPIIGLPAIVPIGFTNKKVIGGTNLFLVTNDSEIDNRFLYWLLKSPVYKRHMKSVSTGTTVRMITKDAVESFTFKCPPKNERLAISDFLWQIDDKIENNLAMNKTLEDMAMALYKHWFVDFDAILENTLADYVHLNTRLSIKKGEVASYVNMKALPTEGMSVSEVDRVIVKGGAKFQNGDTLLARITPCLENGKTAFVDFLDKDEIGFGSTEFLVLRAKEGISKFWVYCLSRDINLVNHAVSCMIGTSGRQRVQNDPFLQYELPKINKDSMREFEVTVAPWFKKVRANTNENQTLTKLRDTLLPKLISGEVRVKEIEQLVSESL